MKAGRVLRIGALTLGVAACVAVVGVLGWFFYSQMPCEEARQLEALFRQREKAPDPGNAYLDVFGFSAPADQDAHEHGQRRIAWLIEAQQFPDRVGDDPAHDDLRISQSRTPAGDRIADACGGDSPRACVEAIASVGSGKPLSRYEELLLARYETLLDRTDWFESLPPAVENPLPAYADVMEAQRIRLIRLRLAAANARNDSIRDALDRDLVFWRRMMRSSDTLIAKMIAVAGIRRHFTYANLVLRELPADRVLAALPASWHRPASEDELAMWRVMAGEYAFARSAVRQALDDDLPLSGDEGGDDSEEGIPARILGKFMRRVAPPRMLNQHARRLFRLCEAYGTAPLERYPQVRETLLAEDPPGDHGDFTLYPLRVASIEGMRRASLLVAQLRGRGVAAAEVADELEKSELRRAFDGRPFTWNASEGAVVHRGPEKKRDAIALVY